MRRILISIALLLPSIGFTDSLPKRKGGLWRIETNSDLFPNPLVSELCTDQKIEEQISDMEE